MAVRVFHEGLLSEPSSSGNFVFHEGVYSFESVVAATEVFVENRTDAISLGEKLQTASQINGVLVT